MEGQENTQRKLKSGINKTAILVALILGLSIVGYGYMNISYKNKVFEAEQAEKARERLAEEAERAKVEREKEQAKQALNTCLASAEENYHNQWNRECKSQGKLTSRCVSLNEMTFDEYVEQNNIPQDKRLDATVDFYEERSNCSCRLPLDNADRINEALEKGKDECFKKYPVE